MVTAVMLSWKREDNVKQIVSELSKYHLIDEFIVWNNNPDIDLDLKDAKVIQTSGDMGLYTRFIMPILAKNQVILNLDDDLIFPESTVNALYESYQKEPDRLHSLFGRNPSPDNTYAEIIQEGEAEISLTRCCLYNRQYALEFFKYKDLFTSLQHETFGNGEDIIFSYMVYHLTGKKSKIHRLEHLNLPEPFAIQYRANHKAFRTELMIMCKKHFGL